MSLPGLNGAEVAAGERESPQTWRLGEPPAFLSRIKYYVAFFVLLFFPFVLPNICCTFKLDLENNSEAKSEVNTSG